MRAIIRCQVRALGSSWGHTGAPLLPPLGASQKPTAGSFSMSGAAWPLPGTPGMGAGRWSLGCWPWSSCSLNCSPCPTLVVGDSSEPTACGVVSSSLGDPRPRSTLATGSQP